MSTFGSEFELSTLTSTDGFKIGGESPGDYLGLSVSSAGDVNGDGFDDIILGASHADPNGYAAAGAAYVVFGKADGFEQDFDLSTLDGTNGFKIVGEAGGDYAGGSVSSAGDVNGDGYDDVIVGASFSDPNGQQSGSAYIIFGSAVGFPGTIELATLDGSNGFQLNGEGDFDFAGDAVSSAGDVNGDGLDDILIGAPTADLNGWWHGAAYVVFGTTDGFEAELNLSDLNGTNGFKIVGEANLDYAGRAVSSAGDINGDGFDDILIGASHADPNGLSSGAAYVVFGTANEFTAEIDLSTLNGTNGFQINGEEFADFAGWSVASAGDINGDGYSDLLIGTGYADTNGNASGAAYVLFGRSSGFSASVELSALNGTNGFQISGEGAGDLAGQCVSSAGDINGDGFDDILIGATGAAHEYAYETIGAAYVIFGAADGFSAEIDLSALNGTNGFQITGETYGDSAGISVSAAGDINGDGFDDILVGASLEGSNGYRSGATYVIFGKATQATSGNDTLTGSEGVNTLEGLEGNDTLFGMGGDDLLYGGSGVDVLDGGEGNDFLDGGTGSDSLLGGAGNDILIIDVAGDCAFGSSGVDEVRSTSISMDLTFMSFDQIENATLLGSASLNIVGTAGANRLTGNSGNNQLIGSGGNDSINGGAGSDTIEGGTGDDSLSGGTGIDTLIGGAGNDTYISDGGDTITETAGEGTDTIQSSVSFTLGANFENLVLTGTAAINGTGNTLANRLTGNSGNNVLNGGGGNDLMLGGAGNDTYIVNGGDTITENAGQGTDTVQSSVSLTLGANLENLVLTGTAAMNGTGNTLANRLTGNSGNNVLNGAGGSDVMLGGAGNDTYITDGGDTITENASQGTDTVQSSVSFTLGANLEKLTLTGSSGISGTGNTLSNTIVGNGGNNTLNGSTGNDTLTGSSGSDTFVFNTSVGSSNVDRITDFNVAADTIRLENAIFTGLANGTLPASAFVRNTSGNAADASDRIIYESDTGNLYFDRDGTGGAAKVHFATIGTNLAVTNADFFVF